jgi:two-component system, LuxR family, response regulator FixJ
MIHNPALIYLVDDDAPVRDALGLLLRTVGYRVSTHASAASLLETVNDTMHACVIVDIRLVGASGLSLASQLRAREVRLPLIFISAHADVPSTVQAFKLGAIDLLQKPIHEQSLIDAVERALASDASSKAVARHESERAARLHRLTEREFGVLRGIAQGNTNRELANLWGVSTRTVESHRASMFDKLEVRHVLELAPYVQHVSGPVDAR